MDQVTVNGTSFIDAEGNPVTYAGQDAYSAFGRWMRGDNPVDAFLNYQATLAEALQDPQVRFMRVLRIFFMVNSFDHIWPQNIPNFYPAVRSFIEWVGDQFGFYVDAEVFADAQIIMPNTNQQFDHFAKFCDAVRGLPNVLVSLGNEWPGNGFQPNLFTQPEGLISSAGSSFGDWPPPVPPWIYSKYHGRRDGLKGILSSTDLAWAVNGYPGEVPFIGVHQACIHDEPIGAADQEKPGSRTNRPEHFYKLGADAALWGAGGTFHSDCGIKAIPYSAQQQLCANAFFVGMSKIDPRQRFVA